MSLGVPENPTELIPKQPLSPSSESVFHGSFFATGPLFRSSHPDCPPSPRASLEKPGDSCSRMRVGDTKTG